MHKILHFRTIENEKKDFCIQKNNKLYEIVAQMALFGAFLQLGFDFIKNPGFGFLKLNKKPEFRVRVNSGWKP